MRQKVGAARLLPQGKDHPEGNRRRQQDASQPRPRIEQQEVESHQREAGRCMGTRKAAAGRQVIRPVLEQVHVRAVAAESGDVPGAVHVGADLEGADDRRAKRDGDRNVGCLPAPRAQAREPAAADDHDEGRESDDPDQGRAAAVNQLFRPPAVRADPRLSAGVEEPGRSNPAVEIGYVYQGGG